jgi:hypothetical protein
VGVSEAVLRVAHCKQVNVPDEECLGLKSALARIQQARGSSGGGAPVRRNSQWAVDGEPGRSANALELRASGC